MDEDNLVVDKWLDKKVSISIGKLFIIAILFLLTFFIIKIGITRTISDDVADDDGLEISNLIRKVKKELVKADTQRINNNEVALFALKDFRMEINFTVRSVNKAGAGVDYKFVTVEGGAETSNEKVQKLMLHWDAIPSKADTLWSTDTGGEMTITPIDTIKNKMP